jgi:hypothetical protein
MLQLTIITLPCTILFPATTPRINLLHRRSAQVLHYNLHCPSLHHEDTVVLHHEGTGTLNRGSSLLHCNLRCNLRCSKVLHQQGIRAWHHYLRYYHLLHPSSESTTLPRVTTPLRQPNIALQTTIPQFGHFHGHWSLEINSWSLMRK